jgi:DNA helicase-2/ATP-dependent DNA helicase PcrA
LLDSLLSTLNPRQLESIQHTQAPQLILAGAGTGKTTTITAKIAYMCEKVEKLLQRKEIHVKTFHSFCAELIKDHADRCKDRQPVREHDRKSQRPEYLDR